MRASSTYNHIEVPFIVPETFPPTERESLFGPSNWQVLNSYLKTHPEVRLNDDHFAAQHHFYKGVLAWDATSTICVPFDVDDDPLMASETLRQLNGAAQYENFEVVLGVNGNWPQSDSDGTDISRQHGKYEKLVSYLRNLQPDLFPDLTLRTLLTHVTNRTMNRTWSRLLHSIMGQSIVMKRAPNYPVMRFDSDSTGVRRKAPFVMAEAIRNNEAHLVKVPTSFNFRWGTYRKAIDFESNSLSPAERQAATVAYIYALAKDFIETQLEPTEERSYNEESGSGAQLINWLRVLTIARHNDPEQLSNDGENKIFLGIAKVALDEETAPLRYIDPKDGIHHSSHRRMKELALSMPAWQLPLGEEGPDYKTFVHMRQERQEQSQPRMHTLQEVLAMVGILLLRQEKACGRTVILPGLMQSKLKHAIGTARFRNNGQPADSFLSLTTEAKRLGARYLEEAAISI